MGQRNQVSARKHLALKHCDPSIGHPMARRSAMSIFCTLLHGGLLAREELVLETVDPEIYMHLCTAERTLI